MNRGNRVVLHQSNFVLLHPRGMGAYGTGLKEVDAVEVFHRIASVSIVTIGDFLSSFTDMDVKTR